MPCHPDIGSTRPCFLLKAAAASIGEPCTSRRGVGEQQAGASSRGREDMGAQPSETQCGCFASLHCHPPAAPDMRASWHSAAQLMHLPSLRPEERGARLLCLLMSTHAPLIIPSCPTYHPLMSHLSPPHAPLITPSCPTYHPLVPHLSSPLPHLSSPLPHLSSPHAPLIIPPAPLFIPPAPLFILFIPPHPRHFAPSPPLSPPMLLNRVFHTGKCGWGKKLTYVFGVGRDGVADVIRRYTQQWSEVGQIRPIARLREARTVARSYGQAIAPFPPTSSPTPSASPNHPYPLPPNQLQHRRTEASEAAVAAAVAAVTARARASLTVDERRRLEEGDAKEREELSGVRGGGKEGGREGGERDGVVLGGRQTGSVEWRAARGELGLESGEGDGGDRGKEGKDGRLERRMVDEHVGALLLAVEDMCRDVIGSPSLEAAAAAAQKSLGTSLDALLSLLSVLRSLPFRSRSVPLNDKRCYPFCTILLDALRLKILLLSCCCWLDRLRLDAAAAALLALALAHTPRAAAGESMCVVVAEWLLFPRASLPVFLSFPPRARPLPTH
ncbi:unnamed protein product [Closterium sp. Naga37s-1]|nr:unnamed protein product [Closterium sp. Naga37s-1]